MKAVEYYFDVLLFSVLYNVVVWMKSHAVGTLNARSLVMWLLFQFCAINLIDWLYDSVTRGN